MFIILCETVGGVTGYRYSYLKDLEGKTMRFQTKEEAVLHCPKDITTKYGATITYRVMTDVVHNKLGV